MKHEPAKQRAVAAIRTIMAAAKELAQAEADYCAPEQSKRRPKQRKGESGLAD